MADIRIKDLATTATTTASDDFMAVDGATNGTRKLSAATPAFLTSVTTPSLTAPASTNLTLAGGSSGASLVLGQGTTGATIATSGTGAAMQVLRSTQLSASTDYLFGVGDAAANSRSIYLGIVRNSGGGYYGLINIYANTAPIVLQDSLQADGNVLIGGTTNIAGSGGLKIFGTTAGSSGAGALVVAGGLATGAASYFGGGINLTTAASGTSQLTIANTNGTGKAHVGSFASSTYLSTNYFYVSGQTTDDATLGSANIVLGVDRTIKFYSAAASATPSLSLILTLDGATNAATFAGAVTVTGNLVGSGTANQFNAASAELKLGIHTNTTTSPVLSMSTGGVGGNSNLIKFYTGGVDLNAQIKNPVSSQTLEIYAASTLAATFATTGTTFAGTVSPQQATTAAAPTYVKGAIYFDTTLNKLRVGGATAWETITSV